MNNQTYGLKATAVRGGPERQTKGAERKQPAYLKVEIKIGPVTTMA